MEMLKAWKSIWENYVQALGTMQEQAQRTLDLHFSQSKDMQDEARKVLKQGMKEVREAQLAYVRAVEESLRKFEEMVGSGKEK